MNRFLTEPGGGPRVNCAWVEVSRGRFVGGRIVKAPGYAVLLTAWEREDCYAEI
jgi:hypothetical protein